MLLKVPKGSETTLVINNISFSSFHSRLRPCKRLTVVIQAKNNLLKFIQAPFHSLQHLNLVTPPNVQNWSILIARG